MTLIKKPFELKVQPYIKVLIYGQPGVRKTTFGLSAPAPLLIDTDNGVHRVDPRHQTDTIQVDSWESIDAVLAEDLSSYKTLVIDTAGKLLDYMSAYLMKSDPKLKRGDGSLTLQGYGARKNMFINFMARVQQMGKHLVFIAHEKEEKDGDQKIIRPEIGGSSGGDLIKELDLVGYMQSIGIKKTISFEPTEKFYGKNTCKLPAQIDLIASIEDNKPNAQLSGIFDTYQKALEEKKKVGVEYRELLDVISAKVESITNAEIANEVSAWAKSFDKHIWDSKLQAAFGIRDKVKIIGLVFKDGQYAGKPADAAASTANGSDANATGNPPPDGLTVAAQSNVPATTEEVTAEQLVAAGEAKEKAALTPHAEVKTPAKTKNKTNVVSKQGSLV